MIENYIIHLLIIIGIYSILAISLNFSMGYGGLLNLGQIAFFGIGAYTSALLNMNFFIVLFLSGIITSFFSYLLAFATNRLKGDYFTLATLGFGLVFYTLAQNMTSLTNGPLGIAGILRPKILNLTLNNNHYLILTFIIFIASYIIMNKFVKSRFGILMGGVRDNEFFMKVLGKDTFKIRIEIITISAFFAGIAGCLYAHYISFIHPQTFYTKDLILLITIVLLGGLASLKGTIIATITLISIPEGLRFIAMPSNILGPIRTSIYAIILIFILMYKPRGILGKVDLS